ncbi:Cyanophycinase-like protein [Ignavibacterium album JCM 16511]|uniref:Cyanophycinase-like protein n=1 Tax=Ignavibacterium album (strain DSM 19864 / JCM 16511 / NBRC 101810 / Mat9-16) TaxID=945713 RepID=I0ANQ0_IGNAJ|nr:Type 1 glutamine amidotransferase-like domain-containing protein [Ignavibacterium album]AFH50607.1 Cyanophycinase-like protein [Ignavibacterium album JCM 16511]
MKLKIKNILTLTLSLTLNLFAQGYVCAIGGGSENYNDWSDAPYSWIVQKADSGKIIIIDVTDATSWLPNYFMSLGADTAYNKTIATTSASNLQSTYDELITAKAIFIRGGDQWDYIRLWKGTKVDSAIQYVFNNGGVIAGTSAGAAVLGDVDFSAQNGSAYPDEALQNPFYSRMKFENNFLKLVPNVLFDTHFIERGRHGRLIAMLYNLHFNSGLDLIGVGVDDRTAVCISPDGIGEVMGSGAVSIFYKDNLTKYSAYTSGKYTIENLKSQILTKGWKFNFITKVVTFIPSSAIDVDTNRSWQFPLTNFYLTGSTNISSLLNTSFSNYLSSVNSSNVVVFSHPGFSSSLSAITGYLSNNNFNYSVVNLASSNLNDASEASKINAATCFVFTGDSLNVMSYLNQSGNLVPDAFQSAVQSGKPVFFFGNAGKISGEKYVGNTDTDVYASYRGKMTLNDGINLFGDLIFQPILFDDSDFYENRMSSVLWGMMRNRKRLGLYLNSSSYVKIFSSDKSVSGVSTIPYLIVDTREATKVDSSTYRASSSIGPRQVVAFDQLRFSLTNYPQIKYLTEQGRFDFLTEIHEVTSETQPTEFILYQNYPNPFNPITTIKFSISNVGTVRLWRIALSVLKVYDTLGREVATLVNDYKTDGTYEVEFDASHLPSGIYFYRLLVGNYSETKSMVLLK